MTSGKKLFHKVDAYSIEGEALESSLSARWFNLTAAFLMPKKPSLACYKELARDHFIRTMRR